MRQSNRLKIVFSAFFLSIVVTSITVSNPITPGFFMQNFAANILSQYQSGVIPITFTSNVPGLGVAFGVLSTSLGISFQELLRLPIALFGRGLLYTALITYVTKRRDIGAIAGLAMVANPWAGWGYNSIFVHSFGSILFLTLVVCLIPTYSTNQRFQRRLLAMVLLLGLFLTDYTALSWAGGMLLTGVVLQVIRGRESPSQNWTVLAAAACCLIGLKNTLAAYFTVATKTPGGIVDALLGYFAKTDVSSEYAHIANTPDTILPFSSIFYYILAILLLIYGFETLWIWVAQRKFTITQLDYTMISLTTAGAGITGLYLISGRFTQFFVFLLLPALGIMSAWRILDRGVLLPQYTISSKQRILGVVVIGLCLTTTAGFASDHILNSENAQSQVNAKPAADWLVTYSGSPSVLTDLTTRGKMQFVGAKSDDSIRFKNYELQTYAALVERGNIPARFVVIDYESADGVQGFGWQRFQSLKRYQSKIESQPRLQKVFTTDDIAVYSQENHSNESVSTF